MRLGSRGARSSAEAIAGFDGLRALAALTVVTYHATLAVKFAPDSWFEPLLWELKGGVAIFFVVSGALLYLPYARAIRGRAAIPDWRGFARRRMVRILPAYWVALTLVGVGPVHAAVFDSNVWSYYGLSQIYRPQTVFGGLDVAWSLCVEVTFYACLPLIAWFASRASRRMGEQGGVRVQLAAIAGAGLASLVLRGVVCGSLVAPVPNAGHTAMITLPGMFDWFALGMALAVLRAELEAGRWGDSPPAALGRRPGMCVLLAFTAFCAGVPWQGGDMFLPWYGLATHVAIGIGAALLVLAVIVPAAPDRPARPPRLLAHPVAVWIGTVSYGVYLWHRPALILIERHVLAVPGFGSPTDALLVWGAAIAAGLALGAASFYLVERPCQRWFRAREARCGGSIRGGHMHDLDASVHSTLDPLNSSGVAVDHLA